MIKKGTAILKTDPPEKVRECLNCQKPECTNCIGSAPVTRRVARWRQKKAKQKAENNPA